MTTPETAFHWIVGILNRHAIPFQVVGGLAARAHGATRPLADIDLYVPGARFSDFLPDVESYVTFGPEPYVGPHWDLTWMALDYGGQTIEIGDGERVRIFDRRAERWVDAAVDFDTFETMTLFGMDVPVMPKDRLMAYKRRLDRPVDRQDLAALTSNPSPLTH
jgi:hypothetical protein